MWVHVQKPLPCPSGEATTGEAADAGAVSCEPPPDPPGGVVLVVTILSFCIVQAIGIAVGRMLHWPQEGHRHDDP